MVSVQDEALDEVPLQDEDSVEFRMFMAYAQRTLDKSKFHDLRSRTTKKNDDVTSNGAEHPASDDSSASPKKDKKKRRRWKFTPQCLRAPREKKKVKASSPENPEETRVKGLVQRLRDIVQKLEKDQDGVAFRGLKTQASVQHDGDGEEDLIDDIVEYLRREGDQLNSQMVQEQSFLRRLRSYWSYSFFQRLTESYTACMVPESEAEEVQQSNKIALCVHATTKLTALDIHPMNKMFGYGARYVRENYSQWIKEHGGWEKVMGIQPTQEEEEGSEEE